MESLDERIHQVIENLWAHALGWPIQACPDMPVSAEESLEARVEVTGAWEGAICVRCPMVLAREAAAALFGVSPESTSDDQARDALGELTNMSGGSLKALFPGPSRLVPPSVGGHEGGTPQDRRLLGQVAFQCRGHLLHVTVVERATGRTSRGR